MRHYSQGFTDSDTGHSSTANAFKTLDRPPVNRPNIRLSGRGTPILGQPSPGRHEKGPCAVSSSPDLTPLAMQRTGNHVRFGLAPTHEICGALPANYETLLNNQLASVLQAADELTAEIDLAEVPAISSRQLGSLIALQKVLRQRFTHIPLVGVSQTVRHLLELTRTDQLFDV